jgi:hypothetical protein
VLLHTQFRSRQTLALENLALRHYQHNGIYLYRCGTITIDNTDIGYTTMGSGTWNVYTHLLTGPLVFTNNTLTNNLGLLARGPSSNPDPAELQADFARAAAI